MSKVADAAARLIRDQIETEAKSSAHAAGRARLVGALTSRAPRDRRWLWALPMAAALGVGIFVWSARDGAAGAAFTVGEDSPGEIGTFYSPPAQEELMLRFAQGGTVRLAPGAGARVSRADDRGSGVLLEAGRIHVEVAPGRDSIWQVVAGPYTVRVTGTAFWVGWTVEQGELDVVMERGSVLVRGPRLEGGVTVSEGQRFVTRVSSRLEPESAASAPLPALPSGALPEPSAPVETGQAGGGRPARAPDREPAEPPEPRWSELAARGEHRRVLAAAEARGVDGVLAAGSLDDVAALADAARFTGRGPLAQRALRSLRERFPGSGRAKSAAFVLGRMLDDSGNPSGALSWYETYLAEAPGGALAAEALGRRMVALQRLGRSDEARRSAENYLKRFPKGGYAAQAEKLVEH
jgi:hypothetical protein